MAGFNDLHYGLGVSLLTVTGTGGTLAVPQASGVIRRDIYANGGTLWLVGASQAIGQTHALLVSSLTEPIKIEGPGAFVLLATTDGGTAKIVNWLRD